MILQAPYGDVVSPERVEDALRANPGAKAVMAQASETSTGAAHDVRAMGLAIQATPALFLLDAITGLGTMPLDIDGWGLDVVVGGSQKAFMIPPGMAFISVSDKAWAAGASATLPKLYFNLKKEQKNARNGETTWTPNTSLVIALSEALKYIKALGMDNLIRNAQMLARGHALGGGSPGTRALCAQVAFFLGDGNPAAARDQLRRDREGVPGTFRIDYRQRAGRDEGRDLPHRPSWLLRHRRSVRGDRGARNHSGRQRRAGAIRPRRGRGAERLCGRGPGPRSRGCLMKIVLAERLADAGLRLLQQQPGWEVVVSNPREFLPHLVDADALLVANAVRVNAAVLNNAPLLRVIGRAGIGIENVDVAAATAAGVLVMNTPGGNAVSVAEHTLALMLSLARSIPQANESTKAGRWEKRRFLGSELREKTLGVIGLGSIGREVVKRAKAFEMRIVATDPYVNSKTAADAGVELVELHALYAQADYITLHTALTPESMRMLSTEAFGRMKAGVRIVNCARGELIDEDALKAALTSGKVAGAALDVFEKEPPAEGDPLLQFPGVIATPHIGGATEEAREILGVRIAEQIIEYLQNGIAVNAVNMPALTREQFRTLGPFGILAERLGSLASHVSEGNPRTVRIVYFGKIAENNTQLIRNAAVAGVVNRSLAQRANLINSMQIANDRGLAIAERHDRRAGHVDSIALEIESDAGMTMVEGAVILGKPRLLQVDGIHCEAPLEGCVTFLKNSDVPGVIGYVGGVLGANGINIGSFSLGRRDPLAEAISVIATDQEVPAGVLRELLKNPAVTAARSVRFS